MSATRLPGKPLLKINGLSIISHVFKKAEETNIGEVFVATQDQEIIDDVKKNGGQAILTNKNHKTGTDRINEAIKKLARTDVELVMNLQGDEPLMNVADIQKLHAQMVKTKFELGTLASNITDQESYDNFNVVKVITKESLDNSQFPEAINFTRNAETSVNGNHLHHIGLYAYTRSALAKFVQLPQSAREKEEKLEQLRALDNHMRIEIGLIDFLPLGVDTPEDLEKMQKLI